MGLLPKTKISFSIEDGIILFFNLSNLDTLRNLIFNYSGKVEGNNF